MMDILCFVVVLYCSFSPMKMLNLSSDSVYCPGINTAFFLLFLHRYCYSFDWLGADPGDCVFGGRTRELLLLVLICACKQKKNKIGLHRTIKFSS